MLTKSSCQKTLSKLLKFISPSSSTVKSQGGKSKGMTAAGIAPHFNFFFSEEVLTHSNFVVPMPPADRQIAAVLALWTTILLCVSIYISTIFLASARVVQNQAHGQCIDGDDQGDAHLLMRSERQTLKQRTEPQAAETPELLCDVPVTVYLCPSWATFEECDQIPKHDLQRFQRVRKERTGVFCWGTLGFYMWGSQPCGNKVWNCTLVGPCSGYQKSERLCAARLHRAVYPCFFDPSNAAVNVQEQRYRYTIWAAVLSCFLVLLTACAGSGSVYFGGRGCYQQFSSMVGNWSIRETLRDMLDNVCSARARWIYLLFLLVACIIILELTFFLLLLPGQSAYSLWGAPQLAVSLLNDELHFVQFWG